VVRVDGAPEQSSIQILKATSEEFASAVYQSLLQMRFYPMQIGGCNVAALIQMPFTFELRF